MMKNSLFPIFKVLKGFEKKFNIVDHVAVCNDFLSFVHSGDDTYMTKLRTIRPQLITLYGSSLDANRHLSNRHLSNRYPPKPKKPK